MLWEHTLDGLGYDIVSLASEGVSSPSIPALESHRKKQSGDAGVAVGDGGACRSMMSPVRPNRTRPSASFISCGMRVRTGSMTSPKSSPPILTTHPTGLCIHSIIGVSRCWATTGRMTAMSCARRTLRRDQGVFHHPPFVGMDQGPGMVRRWPRQMAVARPCPAGARLARRA